MSISGGRRGRGPFLATGPSVQPVTFTRSEFAAHMDDLRSRLAPPVPGIESSLLTPSSEQAWGDTSVPVLADRYVKTPTGLILPVGSAPGSLKSVMKTYMTASEILGGVMSPEMIGTLLSQVSVADTVAMCGGLVRRLRDRDAEMVPVQMALVDEYCQGRTKAIAQALVNDHSVFLAPQLLLAVAKLAIVLEDPDRETTAEDPLANIIRVELGLGDWMGALPDNEHSQWGDLPESLALELVANQHFNRSDDLKATLARYEARWNVLPAQRDAVLAAEHERLFEERTGATLEDCAFVGFGLLAGALRGTSRFHPNHLTQWTSTPGQAAALNLYVADEKEVRNLLLAEMEAFGLDWSANTFRRYPLIRHADGSATLVDPDHLIGRMAGSAAHFEIEAAIKESPKSVKERKRMYGDFKRFRGLVAEDLVRQSLREMTPGLPGGAQQLWTEDDLKAMWPNETACDFVLDLGEAWVCIEVVSHALTASVATATSTVKLDNDIKIVALEKAAQLDATIQRLISDESAFTGQPPVPGKRIYPVVVATSGFPVNALTTSVIRERVASAGLLRQPVTGPLEIVDQGDLEHIEYQQLCGNFTFADLLRLKTEAGMRNLAMDQFMYTEMHLELKRPPRSDALGSNFTERMLNRAKGQIQDAA